MLKYSVCVVIISLSFSSVIAGIPEDMNMELAQQLRKECVSQSGVDESLIHAANNNGGLANDEKLKCYLRCTYVESGTLQDNGDVDQEAVLAVMPESAKPILKRVFETCGTKKGVDDCDTIYQTHKCYYEMVPDYDCQGCTYQPSQVNAFKYNFEFSVEILQLPWYPFYSSCSLL